MFNMSFSEEQFNEKAQELVKISETLNDNWIIIEKESKIYLTRKEKISVKQKQQDLENDENKDDSAANQVQEEIYTIEYHVVFHPNYQVPVLYFNAYRDDSRLVNLEDVSKIFNDETAPHEYQTEIYKIISQADHPVLLRPFYMIHPCHIHEVLSKFPESKNFILTFLTLFGPAVRLKMSLEYEKFYIEKK